MNHEVIYLLYPQVVRINDISDNGVDAFDSEGNIVEIDLDLVESKIKLREYINLRKYSYPSIEDQLDTLYHKGYDGWKEVIQSIKDKYPKP